MGSKRNLSSSLSRREMLKYGLYGGLSAGLSGSLWLSGCTKWRREKKPNIILISIDALRWDHCTIYGYGPNTTPTLKKLAEAGVCFESAYAPASSTCPSHATMFTSLYPITHGILRNNGTKLDPKFTTLAEHLCANGYNTAAIVSAFPLHSKFGFNQGFSYFDDKFVDEYKTMPWARPTYFGVKVTEAFDQDSAETTRKAIQWIKSCDSDKPFFLFIHYIDPHHPYNPPEPFASRFQQDVISQYDGEIAYVDSNIKKLLEILDSKSLIIITADHGEGLMQRDNFMLHARHIYDEAVRVPLIFYGPNHIKKGLRFSEPVDFLTIAPTIVDLAGIEPCHSFAGKSLKRCACDGQPPDANHPIYLMSVHLGRHKFGIRLGHWKYILNQGGEQELFNLVDDPKELSNVVAIFPERANILETRLKEWMRLYKGPRPKPPVLSDEDRRKFESLGYLR